MESYKKFNGSREMEGSAVASAGRAPEYYAVPVCRIRALAWFRVAQVDFSAVCFLLPEPVSADFVSTEVLWLASVFF